MDASLVVSLVLPLMVIGVCFLAYVTSHRRYDIYVQEPEGWRLVERFMMIGSSYEEAVRVFGQRIARYESTFSHTTPHSFVCVPRDRVGVVGGSSTNFIHSAYLPTREGSYDAYVCNILSIGRMKWQNDNRFFAWNDRDALQAFLASSSFWSDDLVNWRLRKLTDKEVTEYIVASGKGPQYLKTGELIKGGGTNCSELQNRTDSL